MAIKQLVDKRIIRAKEEKFAQIITSSVSSSTRKNYTLDIRRIESFGYVLPFSPQDVIEYLLANAGKLKFTTLNRQVKAIKFVHKLNDYKDPTEEPAVKRMLQGISRKYGVPLVKAKPLTSDDLKKIHTYFKSLDSLYAIRNNAIFLVGFFGAFRRNELVRIEYRHVTITDEGLTILVPRSKTDQHNKGETVLLPRLKTEICPVRALEEWLQASKIKKHYIFCPIFGETCDTTKHVGDTALNVLVKKTIAKVGLPEPEKYSTHSLRRGFATQAHKLGASIPAIQRQGRWKSTNSVLAYIDDAHTFEGHPLCAFDD